MYTYKSLGTKEEFHNLSADWNDLLGRKSFSNPFLTWDWMYTWWNTYSERISNISLCIITVRDEGLLIGLLPGFIQLENNINTFYFMGSRFESSDYLEMICEDEKNNPVFIEDSIKYLLSKQKVDVISFNNVLYDSIFINTLKKFASNNRIKLLIRLDSICPFIDINGSWNDYVQGLSKNMRYNLRRRTRKIQNDFHAEFRIVNNCEEIDEAINELFLLHQVWFSRLNKKDSFQGNLRKEFHKKIAHSFFKQDILRLFQIKVNNKTIGVLYCYEYANQLFFFQSGSDPEWSKYSVGLVIMGHAIQYSHTNRLSRFDFLRGAEDYKFNWTNKSRLMGSVYLGVSGRGKMTILKKTLYIHIKTGIKKLLSILGKS